MVQKFKLALTQCLRENTLRKNTVEEKEKKYLQFLSPFSKVVIGINCSFLHFLSVLVRAQWSVLDLTYLPTVHTDVLIMKLSSAVSASGIIVTKCRCLISGIVP